MELRQLAYFVAIAQSGTITAAAQKLHMSQPPLSLQLQNWRRNWAVHYLNVTPAICA